MKTGILLALLCAFLIEEAVSIRIKITISFGRKRDVDEQPRIPTLPCTYDVYDVNKDGSVTLNEFEETISARSFEDQSNGLFYYLDGNGDGILEESEFLTRAPAMNKKSALLFPDCLVN